MELTLTDEEKAAATWLELDDAAVGRLVKYNCSLMAKLGDERDRIRHIAAALMLVKTASACNADELTQEINNCTDGDKELGDWEITVRRVRKEQQSQHERCCIFRPIVTTHSD